MSDIMLTTTITLSSISLMMPLNQNNILLTLKSGIILLGRLRLSSQPDQADLVQHMFLGIPDLGLVQPGHLLPMTEKTLQPPTTLNTLETVFLPPGFMLLIILSGP